jgi:hypothetical protein
MVVVECEFIRIYNFLTYFMLITKLSMSSLILLRQGRLDGRITNQ